MKARETYLGDGLYASDDGFMVTLRAPRDGGDHWVGLEPEVIESLLRLLEKSRGLEITVKRKARQPSQKTEGNDA